VIEGVVRLMWSIEIKEEAVYYFVNGCAAHEVYKTARQRYAGWINTSWATKITK